MQTAIFFDPWVGKDFGKASSIFDKKIMVLGDSHYCEGCDDCGNRELHPECSDFTTNVVKDYMNPDHEANWKKTYSTFINSIYGKSTSQLERENFFSSVSLYNFLQVAAGEDAYSAGSFDYSDKKHLDAFYEVLNAVEPDVVICWGSRVWDSLPDNWNNYGDADKGSGIKVGDNVFNKYYSYPYKNKNILLIGVRHPCSGYSTDFHHAIFSELLFRS